MKRFQLLALFLVLFYSAFVAGVYLHSHTAKDPVSADCKLCQASHLSLIQTVEEHCTPELPVFRSTDQFRPVSVLLDVAQVPPGRAPPLA
jgi:hypothetical protein